MRPEYYREYYSLERTNWWFLARKEILSERLQTIIGNGKPLKILNVGAALGASSDMLQRFGTVVSLEYDKYCCEFVKQELHLDFINGSITELPFADNEFDVVCAFDVIEHVSDHVTAVAELHRVCKPGGICFTTVPAFRWLWSEHDEINEHKRRYTLRNFSNLFSPEKWMISFRSYFNFFLFAPIALTRLLSSVFKRRRADAAPESDFGKVDNGVMSRIFYRVFRSESVFIRNGIGFPVGVSIMLVAKKRPAIN